MSTTEPVQLKVVVVDDEPPARARLRSMLAEHPEIAVVGEAGSGPEALALAAQSAPDLMLLDIRMPGMDGLEVARHLLSTSARPAVIFTTAYDSHALAAFEAQALDYLLKPIRRERLAAALRRALGLTQAQREASYAGAEAASAGGPPRTHLSASVAGELRLVPLAEVRYLRADQKYVSAGHPSGELVLDESLVALEAEFGDRFLRVHRNALVAERHVRRLTRNASGRPVLELDGVGDTVEVSRRLLGAVRDRLRRGELPVPRPRNGG